MSSCLCETDQCLDLIKRKKHEAWRNLYSQNITQEDLLTQIDLNSGTKWLRHTCNSSH
jgi:hypothetical protein